MTCLFQARATRARLAVSLSCASCSWLVCPIFLSSLAGCTAVLGLEDRELSDDAGDVANAGDAPAAADAAGASGDAPIHHDAGERDATGGDAAGTEGGPGDAGHADRTAPPDAPVGSPTAPDAGCTGPGGTCIFATGLTAPWLIVADDTSVYWTESGSTDTSSNGAVKSCPVAVCTQPIVYASNVNAARGIAVDAQRVYWDTSTTDTSVDGGGVFSCPIAGCDDGGPTQLASGIRPYGLAIDDTNLYWVDVWDESVHIVPKDGSGNDVAIVAPYDANNPLYISGRIAIDPTSIYINESSSKVQQGIYTVPFSGGAEPMLFYAGHDANDWPIAVDGTYVYYGEAANSAGYILRIDKTSLDMTQIVTGLQHPSGIAIDNLTSASTVYWTDLGSGGDGRVGRVSSDGTGQVDLVTGLAAPGAIAINGAYAFWNDWGTYDATSGGYVQGTGSIWRTPR